MSQLGDRPIEPADRALLQALAGMLDETFNGEAKGLARKTGFILLIFPFGTHEGRCKYISNGDRRDVIVLLKEQLARFEGQPELKGRA